MPSSSSSFLLDSQNAPQLGRLKRCKAFGSLVPSADTVFTDIELISESQMTRMVNEQLQALPRCFSKVIHKHRPKNTYLIIDFHRDPSYSKKHPKGVTKGQPKNHTQYAWSYFTAELLIGERRQTIAIVVRHKKERMIDHVSRLFAEIPARFHYQAVIFDGEFPTVDVLQFFHQNNLHFLGRFPRARGFQTDHEECSRYTRSQSKAILDSDRYNK